MSLNLNSTDYVPHFAGHESFHLRYGWLKKAFDQVLQANEDQTDTVKVFTDEDAIARFGVGKNMVAAIRFWSTACGIIEINNGRIITSRLGNELFGPDGCDPYLENPNALWLLHWHLASNTGRTSFFWTFNNFNEGNFTKALLEKKLLAHAEQHNWKKVNASTVEKDIAVLLNTYAAPITQKRSSKEDSLSSPLAELGLLRQNEDDKKYHLGWGLKPTLSNEVFLFSLLDFWSTYSDANTLNIQSILLEPGSPGRIFLMDENDLAVRLMRVSELTHGALSWSETAGLKQVVRNENLSDDAAWSMVHASIAGQKSEAA